MKEEEEFEEDFEGTRTEVEEIDEVEELDEDEEEETTGGGTYDTGTEEYTKSVTCDQNVAKLGQFFSGKMATCTSAYITSCSRGRATITKRTSSKLWVKRTMSPCVVTCVAYGKKLTGKKSQITFTIRFI